MARRDLSFSSSFSNNVLIIMDGLADGEYQTAAHLRDHVLDMSTDRPGYCRYHRVGSADEILGLLDELPSQCANGLRPIIHIEAHGDKEKGLYLRQSGEFIPWGELLKRFLAINKASDNNLGVVMASCYGLLAIMTMKINQPVPFYFLIGTQTEIAAGDLEESMKGFYLEINRTGSLDEATKKLDSQFRQLHCEKFFYETFAKYMKRNCVGAGKRKRIEDVITAALNTGAVQNNRATLRALRKNAKVYFKSEESSFNKIADRFLHGRRSVEYTQFEQFVKGIA